MRDGDVVLREDMDLLFVDDDTMRCEDVRAEQTLAREQSCPRCADGLHEPRDCSPGAASVLQITDLRFALRDVRRERKVELPARAIHRRGNAVRRVRRDTDPDAIRLGRRNARAQRLEVADCFLRIGTEDLEIDDAA